MAELIPYYTFDGGPLVLWFRHPNKDPVLLYFAEECNKASWFVLTWLTETTGAEVISQICLISTGSSCGESWLVIISK